MTRPLPSLTALRAFEAAGRHLSFKRAAEELRVSQSAISHQVRALEGHLGLRLFERLTRRLRLTPEGGALFTVVNSALDELSRGVESLRRGPTTSSLTLSLTYPIGAKWLAPHLGSFVRRFPDVDVRLHYSQALVDFAREGCDLAIRWGLGGWRNLEVERLLPADLVPVCSPERLAAIRPGANPEDLQGQVLLHEDGYEDWCRWFEAAGLDPADARRGPIIEDPLTLIQAAVAGDGVTLSRLPLVLDELAAGRLVRLFGLSIERDHAYWLVYPAQALERPLVGALRDHLLAAAAEDNRKLNLCRPCRPCPPPA
jgi:LysR family glycine cleavage system transcriptional activator